MQAALGTAFAGYLGVDPAAVQTSIKPGRRVDMSVAVSGQGHARPLQAAKHPDAPARLTAQLRAVLQARGRQLCSPMVTRVVFLGQENHPHLVSDALKCAGATQPIWAPKVSELCSMCGMY